MTRTLGSDLGLFFKTRLPRSIGYLILILLAVMAVAPLAFSLAASFKTAKEYAVNPSIVPAAATLENYVWAMKSAKVFTYLRNSMVLVPSGLLLYLVICISAGFAFGKLRFKFRLGVFTMVLFLMIFPQMLLLIPMFKLMAAMKLTNTFIGVILAWVAYFAPFGTYIMTGYFRIVPDEMLESARMDGASNLRILVSIMGPIGLPMIGNIAIIGFLSMWNELPFSMVLLQKLTLRTVTLSVALLRGQYGLSIPAQSTVLMLSVVVPILVFLFFQKYVTQGVTAGAIKG
jgi:ABC-type glycerol-3-phosphate transport system permease component